jgi:hypothetical protein
MHRVQLKNGFTESLRKKVDGQFKKDMYKECSQYSGFWNSWKGVVCRRLATTYYNIVRECGTGGCSAGSIYVESGIPKPGLP